MAKFRKKPVTIEAVQWTGNNIEEVLTLVDPDSEHPLVHVAGVETLDIVTLEGVMLVSIYDWIIRGVTGELYPCKPHIFDMTYEPVIEE